MTSRHPALDPWDKLGAIAPYPREVALVPEMIAGQGFFPGGVGLVRETNSRDLPPWPLGGVMVLGQDFDTVKGYRRSRERGGESSKSPTWRAISELLISSGLDLRKCFFTNVYIGLRKSGRSTGQFPGRHDSAYVSRCLDFLSIQFVAQRPSLVVVLGSPARSLLASRLDDLKDWRNAKTFADIDRVGAVRGGVSLLRDHKATVVSLVHPSYRQRNVGRRRYGEQIGENAEMTMLKEAGRLSGLIS